jgi:hypothetical protein
MKPFLGVSAELIALAAFLSLNPVISPGPIYVLYVVAAQFVATYLVHCPAHYFVGRVAGIRFRSIRLGRTTLARALPPRFRNLARLVPIVTLLTDRSSMAGVPRSRVSAMYLSGTVASSASAIIIAAVVTPSGSWLLLIASWTVAAVYLLFDLVFSPRSGDVMRARRLAPTRLIPNKPVETYE